MLPSENRGSDHLESQGERTSWIYFLTWRLISTVYVTLGEFLTLSVPQFLKLYNATAIPACRIVGRLGIIYVKCLEYRYDIAGNYE